jgi:predicted transcriptional regulator of viral defense system
MSNLIESTLRQSLNPIITEGELANLFPGGEDSRYARTKRAVQKGELIRVKRGLYVINKKLCQQTPNTFALAQRIYGPSYVSLESALSYHALIPEAVYSVTSATIKRPNAFTTPLGNFHYLRLPKFNFFIGVTSIKDGNNAYMMASPWKALLDYIYCYKKNYHDLADAAEDLRLDIDEFPNISEAELKKFDHYYQNNRVSKFINNLEPEYKV